MILKDCGFFIFFVCGASAQESGEQKKNEKTENVKFSVFVYILLFDSPLEKQKTKNRKTMYLANGRIEDPGGFREVYRKSVKILQDS